MSSMMGFTAHDIVGVEVEQYTLEPETRTGFRTTHVLKLAARDVNGALVEVVLFSDDRLLQQWRRRCEP